MFASDDEINEFNLEFDFGNHCSMSLSQVNVHTCLKCGIKLTGRERLEKHSIENGHSFFINYDSGEAFDIFNGAKINSERINGIKEYMSPSFSVAKIHSTLHNSEKHENWLGGLYLPGMIGINNTDGCSDDVISALNFFLRIIPIRNALLLFSPPESKAVPPLLKSLSFAFRRICSSSNMKGLFTPHDFLQVISGLTSKRFGAGRRDEAFGILSFILTHKSLKKLTAPSDLFDIKSEEEKSRNEAKRARSNDRILKSQKSILEMCTQGLLVVEEKKMVPLNFLSLDLPSGGEHENLVCQLSDLFEKRFGGTQNPKFVHLPPYLVVHLKRFQNNHQMEHWHKNQTLVPLPISTTLNLKRYTSVMSSESLKTLFSSQEATDSHQNLNFNFSSLNTFVTEYKAVASISHVKTTASQSPHEGHNHAFVNRRMRSTKTEGSEDYGEATEWFLMDDTKVQPCDASTVQQSEALVVLLERCDLNLYGSVDETYHQNLHLELSNVVSNNSNPLSLNQQEISAAAQSAARSLLQLDREKTFQQDTRQQTTSFEEIQTGKTAVGRNIDADIDDMFDL
eukprot:GDKJ01032099.1.p1 GENE.GDKJ01032099.1~~GDKJ01032099.1.p1  ORF type:complete len:567 (-),score=114.40 GDKJ01032099.1:57-1757(-)